MGVLILAAQQGAGEAKAQLADEAMRPINNLFS
jgi:hypothetical protein